LRVETLNIEHQVLDVTLDARSTAAIRGAALEFVSEINNDLAHLGWRAKGAQNWERTPLMDFKRASAVEVWPAGSCHRATTQCAGHGVAHFKGR